MSKQNRKTTKRSSTGQKSELCSTCQLWHNVRKSRGRCRRLQNSVHSTAICCRKIGPADHHDHHLDHHLDQDGEMFFFKSNLMYSRRLWKRRSDAKNGSRRTPYAGRAGQAERGHGGRLVVRLQELSPPVLHRGRGGVLREDLLVSLHHVRMVQVVVHDHATFPLEQIKCG